MALNQSVSDRFGNRGLITFDRFVAKLRGQRLQFNSLRQPQPKEEVLLHGGRMRDRGWLSAVNAHVVFKGISGRESYCIYFSGCRAEHRVGINAEAKVRLP